MNIIPYEPMYRPVLVNALEAEGLTEDQMSFETDHTVILRDDNGYIGFFSFCIPHGTLPAVNHVLIFKNRRHQGLLPKVVRVIMEIFVLMGHAEFTFMAPRSKEYTRTYAAYLTGGKDEPYAVNDDGWHYLIPIVLDKEAQDGKDIH